MKEYALKEIELSSNIKEKEQVDNEIFLLSKLRHKYLIKYYESFKMNNYCYIVMELCSKENLYDFTRDISKNNQRLEENLIWELFIKICIGVGYLHKEKVTHRDLKTANIFFTNNGNIKIGDLGISKLLETSYMKMQSITGTSLYAAPEIWRREKYNLKIDTWAMGCILYELCKLDYAFYEENIKAFYEKVCSANYSPIPIYFSENMKKAISQLLELDQEKRLTIKRFLIQDYIVNIAQKIGLLPELFELFPDQIKNSENNIIEHIYANILRRNDILAESLFDMNFNKDQNSWNSNIEKIGSYSLNYYPPIGWYGIGLNIDKLYKDKEWIDKKLGWATAYHGLRLCETKEKKYKIVNCNKYDLNRKLELTIKSIIENGLKDGVNQPIAKEKNDFSLSKEDYKLCGEGIYLSFQIEEAKKYTIPISGYRFVLMCKVYPSKIRESKKFKGEFVSDGNYIRPYRILAKKD